MQKVVVYYSGGSWFRLLILCSYSDNLILFFFSFFFLKHHLVNTKWIKEIHSHEWYCFSLTIIPLDGTSFFKPIQWSNSTNIARPLKNDSATMWCASLKITPRPKNIIIIIIIITTKCFHHVIKTTTSTIKHCTQ